MNSRRFMSSPSPLGAGIVLFHTRTLGECFGSRVDGARARTF